VDKKRRRPVVIVSVGVIAACAIIAAGCSNSGSADDAAVDEPTTNQPSTEPPVTDAGQVDETGADALACAPPDDGGGLQDQDMDDHQVPWERKGEDEVAIYFESGGVSDEYLGYLDEGAVAWNRSPCLDVRIVDTCPADVNCVTVSLTPGDDADGNFSSVEDRGFTVGGHIDLFFEQLDRLGDGAKLNVTIHEMGHAVGLRHRETSNVLMNGDTYTDIFDPDDTDFYNLRVLYGDQE
jgi:hypothetical protein